MLPISPVHTCQNDTNYDVGHTMMAINPTMFLSQDEFDAQLEALVEDLGIAFTL